MQPYTDRVTSSDRHVTNEQLPFAQVPESLIYDPSLSDKAVRLYAALRRHGDDPTNCYPSKRRLAELIGCAPASLNRPMTELEHAGWIKRVERNDDRGQTSNGFHVYAAARTSSATPSQESDGGPRSAAMAPIAQEPREREPRERQPVNETPRAPSLVSDAFAEFWKLYPRKIAKPAAQRAWRKVIDPERVMTGLARWSAYWSARNEPQFVPHPATWLNEERWNDEPPPLPRSAGAAPKGPRWAPTADEDAAARAKPSGRVVDL